MLIIPKVVPTIPTLSVSLSFTLVDTSSLTAIDNKDEVLTLPPSIYFTITATISFAASNF